MSDLRDGPRLRVIPREWLASRVDAAYRELAGALPNSAIEARVRMMDAVRDRALALVDARGEGIEFAEDARRFCRDMRDLMRLYRKGDLVALKIAHHWRGEFLGTKEGRDAELAYAAAVGEAAATFGLRTRKWARAEAQDAPAALAPAEARSRVQAQFDRLCAECCSLFLADIVRDAESRPAAADGRPAARLSRGGGFSLLSAALFRFRHVRAAFVSQVSRWDGRGRAEDCAVPALRAALGDGGPLAAEAAFAARAARSASPVAAACFRAYATMLDLVRAYVLDAPTAGWSREAVPCPRVPTDDAAAFHDWLAEALSADRARDAASEPLSVQERAWLDAEVVPSRAAALLADREGQVSLAADCNARFHAGLPYRLPEDFSAFLEARAAQAPLPAGLGTKPAAALPVPAGAMPLPPPAVPAVSAQGPEELSLEGFEPARRRRPPEPDRDIRITDDLAGALAHVSAPASAIPAPSSVPQDAPAPARPFRVKGLAAARRKLAAARKAREAARRRKYAANAAVKELSRVRAAYDAAQAECDRLAALVAVSDEAVAAAKEACARRRAHQASLEKGRDEVLAEINAAARDKDHARVRRLVERLAAAPADIERAKADLVREQDALYAANKAKRALWLPTLTAQRALERAAAAEKEHVKEVAKTFNKAAQALDRKTAAFEAALALVESLENPGAVPVAQA